MQSVPSNWSNVLTLASLGIPPSVSHYVSFLAALTYILILTCNMTIVLSIALDRDLHKPMYVLLLNLPINDMMGATSIYPHIIHSILYQSSAITDVACYLQTLLIHLYGAGALIILTVMAFDRYLAICQPLRYHALMTTVNLRRIITCIWMLDLILVGTLLLMQVPLHRCRWHMLGLHCSNPDLLKLVCGNTSANNIWGLFITVLLQGTSVVVVLFTYAHILVTCILTRKADTWSKALRTCGTHLVVFLVFEMCTFFTIMAHRLGVSPYLGRSVGETILVIPPIMNPLIYGLNTKEIRDKVTQVFHRKSCNAVSGQH